MRISGTRLARGTRLTPVLAIMLAGAMAVVGLQLGVGPAQALTAVSPATAGFGPKGVTLPQWYADASGVRLQPCLLGPPRCFTAAANFVPDTGEAFYFLADANLNTTGHGATPGAAAPASLLRIGLEAGFVPAGTNNPSVFSRVRFRIGVPTPGTYTVTYPFGQKTFTVNALGTPGRDINDTTDSGAFATNATPANFALATGPCPAGGCTQGGPGSPIEPFLEWDGTAPAPPLGFLSDGVTPHGVTGSPTGDNLFRIEGPGINPNPADPTTACTPPALAGPDCVQTTLFKVFAQRAPGLSAGPNALSFPAQAMGTTAPAQVVTLTNTSADPITVSTALTGPQAAEFSATPAGGAPCAGATATLAAGGGTCTLNLSWTAPGTPGTSAAATLAIGGDPAGAVDVALSGFTPPDTPTATPAPGTYAAPQAVSLHTNSPGASLHYTQDGTTPTPASATFASPIPVATTQTLKAITVSAGGQPSPVASFAYTIGLGGAYRPITPARILDTRTGLGAPPAKLGPMGTLRVQVAGVGGVPAMNAPSPPTAVVLNATATDATASGFFTVYPGTSARPLASNLNFTAGASVPNLVEVPLGPDGTLSLYNGSTGSTDAVFDVAGWVTTPESATDGNGMYEPLPPARLLDSRVTGGPLGPDATVSVQVTGQGGVPASGVAGVVLNLTVTEPSAPSFFTVYPSSVARPVVSNLNFVPGQTVPNRVMVPVGPDGKINLYNQAGNAQVVVDVNGWFRSGGAIAGAKFSALGPARVLDSRSASQVGPYATPFAAGATRTVQVAGTGGVPAMNAPIPPSAVVLNVTVTNPTAAGFLTAYPSDGAGPPLASDLNWRPGLTVANLVVVKLGPDGAIKLYNQQGNTDVVVDVLGWYG